MTTILAIVWVTAVYVIVDCLCFTPIYQFKRQFERLTAPFRRSRDTGGDDA